MGSADIEKLCVQKEQALLDRYFGGLVTDAAIRRPENINEFEPELPLKIEAEYRGYLEELWTKHVPDGQKGMPLILEEQKLREAFTDDDREGIAAAYKDASRRTLWERLFRSNHEDVTYYKGLLQAYTRDLLMVMRNDFLEEITGRHIKNKAF